MNIQQAADTRRARPARWVALVVLALTLVAGVLRVTALDRAPPGLYRDEAFNGLDALQVLEGERPIFFAANNGREPLFIYLAAGSIALLGRSPGALRLVSALVGTLTIPALYWLGREWFNWRVGLWAAALAVTSVWMLSLSRIALRTGLLPMVAALALAASWRGQRLRSLPWMLIGGVLFGLSFYTYLAVRFVPIALLLVAIWCLWDRRQVLWYRGWAALAVTAVVVAVPLALYLIGEGELLGRAGQVSILSPEMHGGDPLGTVARSLGRTVRMFIYGGDFIPRHNVPWRPVFTPVLAVAFYGGVALAAWRARREITYRLALVWLVVLLIPTVLAEDAPHFLRASGIVPVVFLFPALTLDWFTARASERAHGWALAFAMLVVVSGALLDLRAYTRHLGSEAVYYQFEGGVTEMAVEINTHLGVGWRGSGLTVTDIEPISGRGVWLADRLWYTWPSVHYLVEHSGRIAVLDEQGRPAVDAPDDLLVLLWPFEDHSALLETLPRQRVWDLTNGALERGDLELEARQLYVSLRGVPSEAWVQAPGVLWDDGIALDGAQLVPSEDGASVTLYLYWRAIAPPNADYSAFRHILCDGGLVGQLDGPPGTRIWSTHEWRAGDLLIDRHTIDLDHPWDETRCQVYVGLYHWQDLTRLSVIDAGGLPIVDDGVILDREGLTLTVDDAG